MVNVPDKLINCPAGYPADLPVPEVRERFERLLGPVAERSVPLNLRIEEEIELPGNVMRQKVRYDVAEGETVPAYHLFLKDLPADTPGVLSIHGHGGEEIFPVGKDYHCHPDPDDPLQYSYRAALAGFRVLAPDALCFGERRTPWGHAAFFFDEINTHMELTGRGQSLAWKATWDNSRAIEVLEELGCKSIGVIGWSGGSTQSYILAAANPKVTAAACFFSFMTLRHQFYQYRVCHCLYHYIPGMVAAGIDWDQVAALAAPRKLFLGWGALDEGTPEPMYRAFVDAIEQCCRKEGLPQSVFVHEEPDRGHEITDGMLLNAIDFLQGSLI